MHHNKTRCLWCIPWVRFPMEKVDIIIESVFYGVLYLLMFLGTACLWLLNVPRHIKKIKALLYGCGHVILQHHPSISYSNHPGKRLCIAMLACNEEIHTHTHTHTHATHTHTQTHTCLDTCVWRSSVRLSNPVLCRGKKSDDEEDEIIEELEPTDNNPKRRVFRHTLAQTLKHNCNVVFPALFNVTCHCGDRGTHCM